MYSYSQEPDAQVSKYEFMLFKQLWRRLPAMHLPPIRGEWGQHSPGHQQQCSQSLQPARRQAIYTQRTMLLPRRYLYNLTVLA